MFDFSPTVTLLNVEAQLPNESLSLILQKLLSQENVSFKEISDAIVKDTNGAYSEKEVFHHLLRALWRGEFEDDEGESVLWIPSSNTGIVIKKDQTYYLNDQKQVSSSPIKQTFNRRLLLCLMPSVEIEQIYPLPLEELRNDQLSWKTVKNLVEWEVLALIGPQSYNAYFADSYLKELRMPQKDFKKWLKDFRNGKYAQ